MFTCNSCLAGHLPLTEGEMPFTGIMILSTQAAFCCTTLMGFLLAVPGKAAQSWTLITQPALFWCSKAVLGWGIQFIDAAHLNSTPKPGSGALTAAEDFSITADLCRNYTDSCDVICVIGITYFQMTKIHSGFCANSQRANRSRFVI